MANSTSVSIYTFDQPLAVESSTYGRGTRPQQELNVEGLSIFWGERVAPAERIADYDRFTSEIRKLRRAAERMAVREAAAQRIAAREDTLESAPDADDTAFAVIEF